MKGASRRQARFNGLAGGTVRARILRGYDEIPAEFASFSRKTQKKNRRFGQQTTTNAEYIAPRTCYHPIGRLPNGLIGALGKDRPGEDRDLPYSSAYTAD